MIRKEGDKYVLQKVKLSVIIEHHRLTGKVLVSIAGGKCVIMGG